MQSLTEENTKELSEAKLYEDFEYKNMLDGAFPTEFVRLLTEKDCSTSYIVNHSNVSKTYLNELKRHVPGQKQKKVSRNILLDICLTINATYEETNHLLKCAGLQPLYSRNKADSFIIWGFLHNLSGREIKSELYLKGYWKEQDD